MADVGLWARACATKIFVVRLTRSDPVTSLGSLFSRRKSMKVPHQEKRVVRTSERRRRANLLHSYSLEQKNNPPSSSLAPSLRALWRTLSLRRAVGRWTTPRREANPRVLYPRNLTPDGAEQYLLNLRSN